VSDFDQIGSFLGQFDDPVGLHHPEDGSIVYANPIACRVAGCGLEDMQRHHVADFGFGASREEMQILARELMGRARQELVSFNCAVRSLDGSIKQLHMKLQPIRIGRREYVMSIGRELGEADRPLGLVGPKLAAIEVADEGLGIIDALGRVRYVNPAAARLFGCDGPDQLIGRAVGELLDETDEMRRAGDTLLRQDNWSGVLMARCRDGARVPLRVRGWRTEGLAEEGGAFFIGSISRLGDENGVEAPPPPGTAVGPTTRNLERLAELGQLACSVVHDLNNYITVILSYTRLGLMLDDLDPIVQSYLRVIEGAANNASRIPDFLLGVARQEPGSITVVSLNKVIWQNRELIEHVLTRKAEVTFDLCGRECLARVDPVQLGQALLNLASNARDAMSGGGHLKVGLEVVDPGGVGEALGTSPARGESWASIWFEDEGCGISGDVADRVFEPFFTTKPPGRGTGLGLPSVKRIVEDNGGRIRLESKVGQGTRIDLYLPLVEVL
jgi:PAS domain S-box-containing protein